jgi:DNA-binding NarL/FixJ family response regulator
LARGWVKEPDNKRSTAWQVHSAPQYRCTPHDEIALAALAAIAGRFETGGVSIRVLVAEDMNAYRDALVAILKLEDDLEVVVEVESGDHVVSAALMYKPDVALLDIGLPGTDGLDAAAELREQLPGCRVLILTGLAVQDSADRALAAGVSGLIFKADSAGALVDAVRRVARGGQVFTFRQR